MFWDPELFKGSSLFLVWRDKDGEKVEGVTFMIVQLRSVCYSGVMNYKTLNPNIVKPTYMTLESVKGIVKRVGIQMPKDELLDVFVKAPRQSTLLEVFEWYEEGWDNWKSPIQSIADLRFSEADTINRIYQFWYDRKGKTARTDNMLKFKAESAWQQAYDEACIRLVTGDDATPMASHPSYYGWKDYKLGYLLHDSKNTVTAVHHIVEDSWDEFNGTFAEDEGPSVGLFAEVTLSSGETMFIRWEGNLMDALIAGVRRSW